MHSFVYKSLNASSKIQLWERILGARLQMFFFFFKKPFYYGQNIFLNIRFSLLFISPLGLSKENTSPECFIQKVPEHTNRISIY